MGITTKIKNVIHSRYVQRKRRAIEDARMIPTDDPTSPDAMRQLVLSGFVFGHVINHPSIYDYSAGEITAALGQGMDPNERTSYGFTPLLVYQHDMPAVRALLKAGADPNQSIDIQLSETDLAPRTVFTAAVMKAKTSYSFLAALIDAGAKVQWEHLIEANSETIADLLLKSGADLDKAVEWLMTKPEHIRTHPVYAHLLKRHATIAVDNRLKLGGTSLHCDGPRADEPKLTDEEREERKARLYQAVRNLHGDDDTDQEIVIPVPNDNRPCIMKRGNDTFFFMVKGPAAIRAMWAGAKQLRRQNIQLRWDDRRNRAGRL